MRYLLLALTLLALASSARAQPPDWGTAHQIDVHLTNFHFTPDRLEMRHGEAYRLHLINDASGGHNFDASQFFAAAQIAPSDQAKIRKGSVELKGGETVDIRLVAPAAGTYKLHCSHFLHSSFGMTGEIAVQ
ncbi:multicopper oxidase domain-containing protein [Sphingomonas sp. MAH-20]|uniref:Multicopper oxidase domain-containing protein n=1 Tax=Sphingomonas horti TaxID=2682842 RepID=A0A6I4J216_9SPHN|nr:MULTISPECIES: cupredoxin domain-containing protein [Sphingomonas]MBA2919517.1 cupredoxin domain-containing protein [Sphingomonas sp. CGMCC 1.13658]MVO78397.1 multicopper oxidase domain-containing protein [Sphingomonas horti]